MISATGNRHVSRQSHRSAQGRARLARPSWAAFLPYIPAARTANMVVTRAARKNSRKYHCKIRSTPQARPLALRPLFYFLLLISAAIGQEDCELEPTLPSLRSRPWFCEPPGPRTSTDDLSACLGEGHLLNRSAPGLCRGRWQWYQVSTVHDHTVPYYEIMDYNGGKQHVKKTRLERNVRHALAFSVQTEFCPHSPDCGTPGQPLPYYTTVSVLVVDGEPLHPWDTATPFPTFGSIPQAIDAYYPGDRYGKAFKWYSNRKSVSLTFGFHTNDTMGCEPKLKDKVNIGIYCSWTPQGGVELDEKQCRFKITAHLIPETVYDGFDASYPIAPAGEKGFDSLAPLYYRDETGFNSQRDAASHYFRISLGSFDVLNLTISRVGPNLTHYNALGQLLTNGNGMIGAVVRREVSQGCPTDALQDQIVNISQYTTSVELPSFCTDASQAADYRFGVLAANDFGPFYSELPEASNGKVQPNGQPSTFYSPRREQTNYGGYRIQVHHVAYFEGVMSAGETRRVCVAYGQWRSFYVETTGESDAVIEVAITQGVSAVYLRSGAPPTLSPEVYDVKSPAGSPLATASPCDVLQATRWYFSLYLAAEQEAQSEQLAPSEFELQVNLRPAALRLGEPVTANDAGGRGFACCGAPRLFRVPNILESQTLTAAINVTSGRVHAVLLKWGSCPSMARDVDTLHGICTGFCTMTWLTTRGEYSGNLYSIDAAALVVPHGHGNAPDKRRAGDWYVAVQALPREAAEFELLVDVDMPIYVPPSARCDRLSFACAGDSARSNGWNASGPPAPPPSASALAHARAVIASDNAAMNMEMVRALIESDIAQRMASVVLLVLGFVCSCWFYRTTRYRRRNRYRVPHDTLAGF